MDSWDDLLRGCQRGEEAAFAILVERFQPRILRLASHMLGNQAEAEEITQETFLQAFLQVHTLTDARALSVWLTRIAARLCLRRTQRRRLPTWPWLRDEAAVHHELEAVDLKDALSRAIRALSPTLRAVVLLRDVLDHPYQEIASILGIPEGTVKSRLNLARAQLRQTLRAQPEEARPCPVST